MPTNFCLFGGELTTVFYLNYRTYIGIRGRILTYDWPTRVGPVLIKLPE